jgi:hypothetical protein
MRTEEEICSAIKLRITQLEKGLDCLNQANGPFMTRVIYEAVREELQTLYEWVLNDKVVE